MHDVLTGEKSTQVEILVEETPIQVDHQRKTELVSESEVEVFLVVFDDSVVGGEPGNQTMEEELLEGAEVGEGKGEVRVFLEVDLRKDGKHLEQVQHFADDSVQVFPLHLDGEEDLFLLGEGRELVKHCGILILDSHLH